MRVLVVRCGALGDLVYATSVIDALKREYGDKTIIDFITTPATASLFDADPRVRQIFKLKHRKLPIILSQEKKQIIQASKNNKYDLLINFEFGKQFLSLIQSINATKKVGAQLDTVSIPDSVRHAADSIKYCYRNIVSKKNYVDAYPKVIGNNLQTVQTKYKLPDRFLIVSPSNSHQGKKRLNYRAWENEKWKELIDKLAKKISVVIIGAPSEEQFFQTLRPFPNNTIDLAGKTSLADLISIIELAQALISTDTGTAHIAAAVNTTTFTLIGPTPADVTGPYITPYNKVNIISVDLPCAPCYKTTVMKNCKDNICMKEISVEMVLNSVNAHLSLD